MKCVKVFMVGFCFLLMAIFISSDASALVISSGSRIYIRCPFCLENGWATLTSFRQATFGSSGTVSCSFSCGHSVSRTTRFWLDLGSVDCSLVGFGDVVSGYCSFNKLSELMFIYGVEVENSCLSNGVLSVYHLATDCDTVGGLSVPALGHSYSETHRTPATCITSDSVVGCFVPFGMRCGGTLEDSILL